MRRQDFAHRRTLQAFTTWYAELLQRKRRRAAIDDREACARISKHNDAPVGRTKVFLRVTTLASLNKKRFRVGPHRIQALFRGCTACSSSPSCGRPSGTQIQSRDRGCMARVLVMQQRAAVSIQSSFLGHGARILVQKAARGSSPSVPNVCALGRLLVQRLQRADGPRTSAVVVCCASSARCVLNHWFQGARYRVGRVKWSCWLTCTTFPSLPGVVVVWRRSLVPSREAQRHDHFEHAVQNKSSESSSMMGNWRIVRAPSPVQSCVAPLRWNGRSASARIPRLLVLRGYGTTYRGSFSRHCTTLVGTVLLLSHPWHWRWRSSWTYSGCCGGAHRSQVPTLSDHSRDACCTPSTPELRARWDPEANNLIVANEDIVFDFVAARLEVPGESPGFNMNHRVTKWSSARSAIRLRQSSFSCGTSMSMRQWSTSLESPCLVACLNNSWTSLQIFQTFFVHVNSRWTVLVTYLSLQLTERFDVHVKCHNFVCVTGGCDFFTSTLGIASYSIKRMLTVTTRLEAAEEDFSAVSHISVHCLASWCWLWEQVTVVTELCCRLKMFLAGDSSGPSIHQLVWHASIHDLEFCLWPRVTEGCALRPHSRKAVFFVVMRADIANSLGAISRHRGSDRLSFSSDGLNNYCRSSSRSSAFLRVFTLEDIFDYELEMDIWLHSLNFPIIVSLIVCGVLEFQDQSRVMSYCLSLTHSWSRWYSQYWARINFESHVRHVIGVVNKVSEFHSRSRQVRGHGDTSSRYDTVETLRWDCYAHLTNTGGGKHGVEFQVKRRKILREQCCPKRIYFNHMIS